jgi:restriction system protein
MTALSWVAFGVVAVWLVLKVAGWILRSFGLAIKGLTITGFLGIEGIINFLGKSHLVPSNEVAEDLLDLEKRLIARDTEKERLKNYKPIFTPPDSIDEIKYYNKLLNVYNRTRSPVSKEADIDEVRGLTVLGETPAYILLRSVCDEPPPKFPHAKPAPHVAVMQPPEWTTWRCNEFAYEITLPAYSGLLKPLNYFVNRTFKKAVEQSESIRARQAIAIAKASKRNSELESLHREAYRTYETVRLQQESAWSIVQNEHDRQVKAFADAYNEERRTLFELVGTADSRTAAGVLARVEQTLKLESWPTFVPPEFELRFDEESKILIVEHKFPDIGGLRWTKGVQLKSGRVVKAANQKEAKEAAARLYPILCLRLACEVARVDYDNLISAVVINGWADYTDRSTGRPKLAYCASLFATKEQLLSINLTAADPIAAFSALKGVAARSLELTPIAPILRLNTEDKRFVEAKEILGSMDKGENLAAMNWEDFEHLCRQIFEMAFAGSGAEVKVTQASRDQGVDAVIFDPDVIRGGKIVVQAKRYTNTVEVSAVRDLYGAVINEGATKGILVTTSHFGPDAYGFAKDKPITLLNGEELLGLLEKYGYKFRIDLEEAKRLNS